MEPTDERPAASRAGWFRRLWGDADSEGPALTRRWLVRTSAAIVVSFALFAAFFFLLSSDDDDTRIVGAARTIWDPELDDPLGEGKAASVEVLEEDGRYRVFVFDIEVLRPPADFEFIETWLVQLDEDREVTERLSVGAFDDIRTRVFPLPGGEDPTRFTAVEFSLEPDDGDASYSGRTLLRGDIVWLEAPPD